jgi:hypothetical protein
MNSIAQVRERLLGHLVHLHHVLVPHLGARLGLAQEPLPGRRRGGQHRGHHLHRHDPLQHVVEGPEDDPERPLPQHLEHLVVADAAERVGPGGRGEERQRVVGLGRPVAVGRLGHGREAFGGDGGALHERPGLVVGREEAIDPLARRRVGARLVEEGGPLGRVGLFQGGGEDRFVGHGPVPAGSCRR